MRRLLSLFVMLYLLYPTLGFSLPNDTTQTMHITANSTTFDLKKGFDTYEGDVKINQGTTRLTADRLTTQKNNHKMEEAIAYGDPAHYWTLPKTGDKEFHAQASIIKFYPLKSLVMLEGNVVITQGENSFHGPMIIYNIKNQIVSAPANPKGRATIVIEPKQLQ